jgi:small conductance mechanosensitive channel
VNTIFAGTIKTNKMDLSNFDNYFAQFGDLVIAYGGTVLLAIVFLVVGMWAIKRIVKVVGKTMVKRDVDESLRPFLKSLIGSLLKVMLIISAVSMLGIEMTSFVAVIGAAGLAVGLALQGSLANFAGGVLILLLKPFKVGDFIDTGSHSGTVREIQIFYTYITTPTNQEIIVPNGDLSNNAVKNFSFHDTRRVDFTFGIGYNDNIDQAKEILMKLITEEAKALKDPAPIVFIENLNDSSVDFRVRAWCQSVDYWDIVNSMSEKVKKSFDSAGVSIPFPQRDIHVHNEK